MICRLLAAVAFTFGLAHAAQAADPVQTNNSNAVWFENWVGLSNGMMRVADPEGRISDVRAELGTPVFQLSGGKVIDGVYRYELRAMSDELVKNRDYSNSLNSDEEWQEYVPKAFYRTGSFTVERGVILRPEDVPTEENSD
jgi:hypothetical protein